MGRVLVTGATGAVGNQIVTRLCDDGRTVRALVRDVARARRMLPEGCDAVVGDITDAESVRRAMDGCDVVYHAAGIPEQWLDDTTRFERVNVDGTRNLVTAALEHRVHRFLYTSTIDVFEAARGASFDESHIAAAPKPTVYERSKQAADRLVTAAISHGLPAIFLHPAGVYGPTPGDSPGINDFIANLLRRRLPALLPGRFPLVYAADVGVGHVLAEARAAVGARYILCDTSVPMSELAEMVVREARLPRVPPTVPESVGLALSMATEFMSRFTHKPPLIPRGQFEFVQWQARPISRRAREELGWTPTPLALGVRRTIEFLSDSGRI